MSETTTDNHGLDRYQEPAVMVDAQDNIVAWNEAFADTFSSSELRVGQELPVHGNRVPGALKTAGKGCIGVGHIFQESSSNNEASWLMLTLPHGDGNKLVVLTQGEVSRAFEDEITGLPNRRDATSRMSLEWRRMLRSNDSLFSIAMVDIDFFKRINDRYGHDVGDEALHFVAGRLNSAMRAGDWVARWGGEEFLLFLHQANLVQARNAAERIRQNFAEQTFVSAAGVKFNMTICLGVVCSDSYVTQSNDSKSCLENMINSVDVLLYDAKQSGRNCCVAQEQGEKIYWDDHSLDLLIKNDDIVADAKPVTDAKDKLAGSMWGMKIRGEGEQAAHRVLRSALKQNRTHVVDAQMLKNVVENHDAKKHGAFAFVPLSCAGLLQINEITDVVTHLEAALAAGIKPVLVVDDEQILVEAPSSALDFLASKKVDLCVRLSDESHIPTGIINHINPAYALVGPPDEYDQKQIKDVLHMLGQHKVRPVLLNSRSKKEQDYLYC